jgi:hypothetical protein
MLHETKIRRGERWSDDNNRFNGKAKRESMHRLSLFLLFFVIFHNAVFGKLEKVDDNNSSEGQTSTKSSSSSSSTCPSKALPSFSSGGLVFFLHLPKTGGTSIRRNLEQFDHIQYIFARNFSVYWDTAPLVEDLILRGSAMQKPNKTVIFYEIHANTAPSFHRMRNRLQRWRDTAARNNVPVFFFTVLRSPIPYALSHFNFFHVDQRNPTFEHCNATEENFLRLSLHNPQCQFLWKGEPSMRAQHTKHVTVAPEECNTVKASMMKLFDWIGTTEDLSTNTLPLLSKMLDLPSDFVFERHRVTAEIKKTDQYFGMENLTASTLQSIELMSYLDLGLYEYAQQRYPYQMWKDNVCTDGL